MEGSICKARKGMLYRREGQRSPSTYTSTPKVLSKKRERMLEKQRRGSPEIVTGRAVLCDGPVKRSPSLSRWWKPQSCQSRSRRRWSPP